MRSRYGYYPIDLVKEAVLTAIILGLLVAVVVALLGPSIRKVLEEFWNWVVQWWTPLH